MRYMAYSENAAGLSVNDNRGGGLVVDCPRFHSSVIVSEREFNAIVEAGMRRMVLRDEDHAAQMMGRAIAWARAQKEGG